MKEKIREIFTKIQLTVKELASQLGVDESVIKNRQEGHNEANGITLNCPRTALENFNDKDAQLLKNLRKEERKIRLQNNGPTKNILNAQITNECCEYIKEIFEIDLLPYEFLGIISLYPRCCAELVIANDLDTVCREMLGNAICDFFADTRMIKYTDTQGMSDDADEQFGKDFFAMIKSLAKDFGYKVIE